MLIGHLESQKWGAPVQLGYFPDTFGNMGQTPQMMQLANLPAAAFGRGVKPIGFDNQVLKATIAHNILKCGGKVLIKRKFSACFLLTGIVMGNEIPSEKKQQSLLETKLADVERYAPQTIY